jgi:hypothetical protein
MQTQRYRFVSDYAAGAFTNTTMDTTVNVDTTKNHPALTPLLSVGAATTSTGSQIQAGTSTPVATLSGGNAFSLVDLVLVTAQTGDYFTFTTTAPQVSFLLAGILAAGLVRSGGANVVANAIRNGGIVQILTSTNGGSTYTLVRTVDLAGITALVTLNLTGVSTVVKVLFTGTYNSSIVPIGALTAGVGTSMSSSTTIPASTTQTSFKSYQYLITCTTGGGIGTGRFSLGRRALGSTGAYTTFQTNLVTGTAYDGTAYIPGVKLTVSPTTAVLNDTAAFTTDYVMMAVANMNVYAGTGGTSGMYTSPVIDTGALDMHMILAEMASSDLFTGATNPPVFTYSTGNTPTPDSTWLTTTGLMLDVKRSDGSRVGRTSVSLLGATSPSSSVSPRARYGQWSLTFPTGLTALPWVRDVTLYSWVPERDPSFHDKIAVGVPWSPGPTMEAIHGLLAAILQDTRNNVLDYIGSMSITHAVDQYLLNIANDLQLPWYNGENPSAYRLRAQGVLGGDNTNASSTQIASVLHTLVSGYAPTTTTSTVTSGLQTVQASNTINGGSYSTTVQQTAPYQVTITIPPPTSGGTFPGYPGLPGIPVGTDTSGNPLLGRQIIAGLIAAISHAGLKTTIVYQ